MNAKNKISKPVVAKDEAGNKYECIKNTSTFRIDGILKDVSDYNMKDGEVLEGVKGKDGSLEAGIFKIRSKNLIVMIIDN